MQSLQKKSYVAVIIVASTALAAAVAASMILPLVMTFIKSENFYVIYYGHLIDGNGDTTEQTAKILSSKPELVIVPYSFPDGELNLTPNVHQQFKQAGIKVVTYTWTAYGARDLAEVQADVDKQMASGVDGIFVDEVTNLETDAEYEYYLKIFKYVKGYGQDKVVIMNPGHYKVSEKVMLVSDIASLEEEWVFYGQIQWITKYPSSRFMGVSSNEYCTSCVNGSNAASKTNEAWQAGIGYHYATDKYIDLPDWFGKYDLEVKKAKQS